MSASLVGSEMCIRDRGVDLEYFALLPRRTVGRYFRSPRGDGQSLVSVSYTHLTLPTICSV
eukprot:1508522-Alexandrium_andersonii.AAC.1